MSYTIKHGLFHWRADGIYREADVLKTFKTPGGADRAASRLYDADRSSDVVARQYYAHEEG